MRVADYKKWKRQHGNRDDNIFKKKRIIYNVQNKSQELPKKKKTPNLFKRVQENKKIKKSDHPYLL
jgi:hypothetical protein